MMTGRAKWLYGAGIALAAAVLLGCGDSGSGPTGGGGAGGSSSTAPTRIAFGSCMQVDQPKPVLDLATASAPDLFVFLGDNLYGDTDDMDVLAAKYDQLGTSPELLRLLGAMPAYAIWDDHDYGRNDAGSEYPFKAESKALFLDFWEEEPDMARRDRDGLYTSYALELDGRTVQLILLDMRWFRDPLELNDGSGMNDYMPTTDTTRTMLGAEQWAWLEQQLMLPADLRIIASSIQFGHEYNGYESWTNMPHERQRLVDLIGSTGAEGVVFISGDAHWAELSRLEGAGPYPLYDLTSSGITEEWSAIPPNANRIGDAVSANNYGFLDIAWGDDEGLLTFGIVDVTGSERIRHEISTSELR